MVQELLPLLPDVLTTEQAVVCLLCLLAGVFLWLSGSIWSRGIITLFAVAIGALLGMYVPRWQLWPINSMAAAVLGAVGFGLIAFLIERLWMGLTLGLVLACWASLGTWIQQRPADYYFPERAEWQVQFMTPPEYARDIYIRLPIEVQQILPYAAGTGMLSGLAIAFLWPRLGRALGMSMLGVTMSVVFGLVLISTQHPDWLQYIPAPPLSQAGTLVGLVMVGLLAQWPFLAHRLSKQDEMPSSRLAAPAQPPPPDERVDRQLVRILQ
jgi:MFS family permease